MNIFLKFFLLLASFEMFVKCDEDLCNSLKEFPGNDSSNSVVKVFLHHQFLLTEKGVIPGLKYNVTLRRSGGESGMSFALSSVGSFESPALTTCESTDYILGTLDQEIRFLFTLPSSLNDSLLLTLFTKTLENPQWSSSKFRFPVRPDILYVLPKEHATLTSEDLSLQLVKTVLVQAPKKSGLQVILEDIVIPEDGSILIYNTTESTVAFTLSLHNSEQTRLLILEEQFLLLDITRCFNCRYRLVIKPIATKYECNSTLGLAPGSLELVSSPCELRLQAPPFHRILLKIEEQAPSERCRKLLLGPLTGLPRQKTWTSCANISQAQTEFYISESNSLTLTWDGTVRGILLNYDFFPQCSNRTFVDSPAGQFCSTGYPDLLPGCDTHYTIDVPFRHSLELQLSVLGADSAAACANTTSLEVRNATSTLLALCFSAAAAEKASFTLRVPESSVQIVVRPGDDLFHRGFCASYKAVPDDASCPYGWVAGHSFCYRVYEQRLKWQDAEESCRMRNGHLASVTDNRIAFLIDDVIKHSPVYKRGNHAYWIGANDLRYENCYEWTDGQPFNYVLWFPGWEKHGWYSVQPSDDGLSLQNCVELRDRFRFPSKGEGSVDRFFWNDRDCRVQNPFVCQRLKPGVTLDPVPVPICNKTITLSWDHPREDLKSPGYPIYYPNNIKCHYHINAPPGQKIVALFIDFQLEESDSCEYDDLTLMEDELIWRRCGDWENKIKLLRHISLKNYFHIIFKSDFSHSYKGFRIEFSLLEERSEQSTLCDTDMFQLRGGQCYLVVNYLETSWSTARQICSEAKAQLAIVQNADQVNVLEELVRSTYATYKFGTVYWVGAYDQNSSWKWLDGSLLNSKDIIIPHTENYPSPACLAIQWKQLRNSNPLRWTAKNCNQPGSFICQKPSVVVPEELNKTLSQLKGNLTSVNYPSNYLNNLDYIAEIIGPPKTRIVVTFHFVDLELQEDCLYDYLLLRSSLNDDGLKLCEEPPGNKEFVSPTHTAYLSFHSDFSVTSRGYSASWETVDLSPCLNRLLLILEATSVVSLRHPRAYLAGLECHTTAMASGASKRLLLTLIHLDLRPEDYLEINLDPKDEKKKLKLFGNEFLPGTQFLTYGNEAHFYFHSNEADSMRNLENTGYNITCETWDGNSLENTIFISSMRKGYIHNMNLQHRQPEGINYTQHVVAPIGNKIHLHLNISSYVDAVECGGSGLRIRDHYAPHKILLHWTPCRWTNWEDEVWSTLHTLTIDTWNVKGDLPTYSVEYSIFKDDHFVNTTMALSYESLESCWPNPCQNGGKCVRNGTSYRCHCFGQYTGLFCHLSWCDVNVCGENGSCNQTLNGCECLPGFSGLRCQQTTTPCSPNPCGENGECTTRNGTFHCLCDLDFEGLKCEKLVMRIPYKPLSQRMLEEPFWLGLITVFTVLLIILCVYCIKRKFADKIEKFLAEEIERSKYQPSPPATRYSLSSTQPSLTPGTQSPQTCPKSLFNRIRKNSLLSAACSPSPTPPDRDASRTFSFDDILRRVHSSKRNRTNNPSSSGASSSGANAVEMTREEAVKKEDEKSRILASLVTPQKEAASRRMSLDEFFRMSERKLSARRTNSTADSADSEGGRKETSFISMPSPKTLRQSFSEIQSIQEQSFEYMSSSESLNGEPSTSEIQADVSPTPPPVKTDTPSPSTPLPSVSITIDNCESEPEAKNCDTEPNRSNTCDANISSRNSSYLEVPQAIPAIKVFSADDGGESSRPASPSRKDLTRKYSVDLPMPKILITANMGSCDSDEASPPRTPNPNKSMIYLSPLAVISTDRTISESNLSTSGYSSISSPGLSRCNSSSPISDEHHHHHEHHHPKAAIESPKKPPVAAYLSVGGGCGGGEKTFFFPQTIACHCHTPPRLLCKRNSYQTTSTDDSIDDEGIGLEARCWEPAAASPLVLEPGPGGRPDVVACSRLRGSPRGRKKGFSRRSPVLSPAGSPADSPSRRASSTSESEEGSEAAPRRRTKAHKAPLASAPSQDSSGPGGGGRSSPLSESNGDSAPMDSRSPASSSSESLSSTKDSIVSEKIACSRHKLTLEHTRSFPPLSQCSRHSSEDGKGAKLKSDRKKTKLPVIQIDSEEEVTKSSEDHPCLRRQEAVVEDDPSDDSSSETTVLLGRQAQQSSSADASEWEAFSKD